MYSCKQQYREIKRYLTRDQQIAKLMYEIWLRGIARFNVKFLTLPSVNMENIKS